MITALLLKMSAPCRNALALHIQHCPPHHSKINLGTLSGDIGLQLVEGGWARAVDLGLQEAPEAEVNGGEVGRSRLLLPTFDQILRTETTNWIPMTSLVSQVSE